MTLVCLASQKGSPGASAAALAITAALRPGPGRRKLLLEADVAGGMLAIRYRLPQEPGLVTLAAAVRTGLEDDGLWRHAVELPGGLPAVVSPDGSEPIHGALLAAGRQLGRYLADHPGADVICDLGRLPPDSPAVELAVEATALLMVARPTAEQLQPAARRLLSLRSRIGHVGWLLVGERPYGPAEVEETYGLPVVGVLADDRRSVEAIEGGAMTRRIRRHPFVRSAVTVAGILGDWLAPAAAPSRALPADELEALEDFEDRQELDDLADLDLVPAVPSATAPPAPPLAPSLPTPPPPPPRIRRPPPAPSRPHPPAMPDPPDPPSPRPGPAGTRIRTPFVHGEDDAEWAGP